jgi:hypothetical protein
MLLLALAVKAQKCAFGSRVNTSVDAVEQAIRTALSRGAASDPEYRRRIYASATASLERSLTSRGLADDDANARRGKLQSAIDRIEAEIAVIVSDAGKTAAPMSVQTRPSFTNGAETNRPPASIVAPSFEAPKQVLVQPIAPSLQVSAQTPAAAPIAPAVPISARTATADPALLWDDVPPRPFEDRTPPQSEPIFAERQLKAEPRPEKPAKPAKLKSKPANIDIGDVKKPRRKGLIWSLRIAFLLLMFVLGFWAYKEAERVYLAATSAEPPQQAPALSEQNTAEETGTKWLELFNANATTGLVMPSGIAPETLSREGLVFVQLSGNGEIAIKLDPAATASFAGKRILFNFIARSGSDAMLQTGVRCDFGAAAACERKRFRVAATQGEYMFALTFSAAPEGGGTIYLTPDLTGQNGILHLNAIRATEVAADQG